MDEGIRRGLIAVAVFACSAVGCTSPRIPGPDGGQVCSGASGRVPTEHRATALACDPSTSAPPKPVGGVPSCMTDTDCVVDGGTEFSHCLLGTCSFDSCLSDADCGSAGACACSADSYGGNARYHPNVCVTAQCHVDSDCGGGGFCSPSHGRCGAYEGFFCHCGTDACVNAATDCSSTVQSCVYSPEASEFTCGQAVCNG